MAVICKCGHVMHTLEQEAEHPLRCYYARQYADSKMGCKHQYFKIKKLEHAPIVSETYETDPIIGEGKKGDTYLVQYPTKHGVLVKCALCDKQKELWEGEK